MRVTTLQDLPRSLEREQVALDWLDNDPPFDTSLLRKARAAGAPISDYMALVAVEGEKILSRVGVQRPTLTTSDGQELFCGIDGVATRPDALRRGLALGLLRAVHRRERARGLRWTMLWTHRTWGAHRLYERLGYRDVYSPPSSLRRVPKVASRPPDPSYRTRAAKASDAPLLESIHRDATAGRIGFLPRFPGILALRFRLGWRTPKDHYLLYRGRRAVGYFLAAQMPWAVTVTEAVVRTDAERAPLLDSMERLARGRWLAIGRTTFANDAASLLTERGFRRYPLAHTTLMARRLAPPRISDVSPLLRLVEDPRFSCHSGDMF
ncbi:MAG TPA: GNAT family N-acetyltransferase [Thermoplasmata archaeon]